ncbi:MAG: hypothetical protein KAT15_10055 [Bacteroidales bacterium]|nr:hypothetical protein [Bacteroidales bacterium]
MKKLLLLIAMILLVSCEENLQDTEALGENADIVGTWVEEVDLTHVEDGTTQLKRADELDPSLYGFTIKDDGSFVERKNAGWCGTPPISYDNFDGTWVALSDSLLEITVGYWGGTMTYQMRIVSLDQEQLRIRYLYAEDRALSR